MAAGKMKTVMGLQRSTAPKQTPAKNQAKGSGAGGAFSRPFGVHFPRSSAQVQPRPPD
ncbi:hypothetical protein M569_08506, partial [Genlisea aurea]